MDMISTKLVAAGVFFILAILSGIWLSSSGKPYSSLIFGVHKLIAMTMIILISVNVYSLYKALDLQTFLTLAFITTSGLIFLALIVTGGLLSLNITLSGFALRIHQVAPLLALVSSTVTIYLLIGGKL